MMMHSSCHRWHAHLPSYHSDHHAHLYGWQNPVTTAALSRAAFIPGYNGNIFGVARDLTTLYHVDLAAPIPTATAVPSGGERRGHTTWSGESGYPATYVLPVVTFNGCVWLVLSVAL